MRRLLPIVLVLLLLVPHASAEDTTPFAWTMQLGEAGKTQPAAIAPSRYGGVYVAGSTNSEADSVLGDGLGDWDGFVTRLNAEGGIRWSVRLGGSNEDHLTGVLETPNGGCLAMGTTSSGDGDASASRGGTDAWLVRLNHRGELLWSKCLGGSLDDELLSIQITEDGQYFACGRTQSRNEDLRANHGGWDAWAILLGAEDGKPVWPERSFRYGEGGDDAFQVARPTPTGWLLLGETGIESGEGADGNPVYVTRPIVLSISPEGEALWEEPLRLGDTGDNSMHVLFETETGWIIAGETNSRAPLMPTPHGGMDIWLLNMRISRSISWQRTYGGSQDERLHSLHALPTGGYLLLGYTESNDDQVFGAHGKGDLWVARLSAAHTLQWQQPIGGSEKSTPVGLLFREDGSATVAGVTSSQDGDIGRHASVRTGFLTELAPNGNLLSTRLISDTEENTLVETRAKGGAGYVLGSTRGIQAGHLVESAWIARMATDDYVDSE